MKVAVFGAGAVGGALAARLAAAGHDVSVVARGATLDAIARDGLTLIAGDRRIRARVRASADPAELGRQEVVISTLKAHQLPALAHGVAPLLGTATPIVFAQNGIPWWYADATADLLDPDGALRRAIGSERIIGGVIQSANDQLVPGVVLNRSPGRNRLIIGEVDGRQTSRIAHLRRTLEDAGIGSAAVDDLRPAMWTKLIANLSVSVLGFLVERTSREVFDDAQLGPLGSAIARELSAVAQAEGCAVDADLAAPAPGHLSSMLQDHRRGRPIETAALIEAPLLLARAHGVESPVADTIAAFVRHKLQRSGGAALRQPPRHRFSEEVLTMS